MLLFWRYLKVFERFKKIYYRYKAFRFLDNDVKKKSYIC